MSDWHDISTAPKDGKPVLLWKKITREHYVAAWIIHSERGPGWFTPDGFQIFNASNWTELPPPPKD